MEKLCIQVAVGWTLALALGACERVAMDDSEDDGEAGIVAIASRALTVDCSAPDQRFVCEPPGDPDKRYVCHATASSANPYIKISVPSDGPEHAPGFADGKNGRADQSPGASADDLGASQGLDCDCSYRTCTDQCAGAPDGAECDYDSRCTINGVCVGGVCQAGPPSCVAGTPVD